MAETQGLKNHTRIVPMYHPGVSLPFLINFVWSIYRLTRGFTGDAIVGALLAIGLLLMFLSVRTQILTVQDRVIRLEMRLRLRERLPADLCAQAVNLPVKQLIALRFAGDAELAGLVRDVVSGSLSSQKDIKSKVKDWQPDYLRA